MSKIRSKNTRPELILRKALFRRGLRYKLYSSKIQGHPDILFTKEKIAVFVDGDFWHGRHFNENEFKTNKDYWIKKIKTNINRDKITDFNLEKIGYTVIRFWEKEIEKDPDRCADIIFEAVKQAHNPYHEDN